MVVSQQEQPASFKDAKDKLNHFYQNVARAPSHIAEYWRTIKDRKPSDHMRKQFVMDVAWVCDNADFDTGTFSKYVDVKQETKHGSKGKLMTYAQFVDAEGQEIADDKIAHKAIHMVLRTDVSIAVQYPKNQRFAFSQQVFSDMGIVTAGHHATRSRDGDGTSFDALADAAATLAARQCFDLDDDAAQPSAPGTKSEGSDSKQEPQPATQPTGNLTKEAR